jgi:LETM1 and EF-hand domain-containing protein 1
VLAAAAVAASTSPAVPNGTVDSSPATPEIVTPKDVGPAEEDDARMTKEQLGELAEALSILTAKSSIVKERDELKLLLEDNLLSEAVRHATIRVLSKLIITLFRNPNNEEKPTRLL